MDDEVSVADLLVREGWGDHEPGAARSRWRVVAVMLAVVIGCGTAAVLVAFGNPTHQDAQQDDQIRIVPMPDRSTGGQVTSDPPSNGGVGGGTPDTQGTATHAGSVHTTVHTSSTAATEPSAPVTSVVETSSRVDPPPGPTGTSDIPPPDQNPPPPPTTTKQSCFLIFCW